jgi:hypothetical protein
MLQHFARQIISGIFRAEEGFEVEDSFIGKPASIKGGPFTADFFQHRGRCLSFCTTDRATFAAAPPELYGKVLAQTPRLARTGMQEVPLQHGCAANTGAQRNHNDILRALSRSRGVLS